MKNCLITILLIAICLLAAGQNEQQASLLREAYNDQSSELLIEFFNNWADELSSNEDEATNRYVAEAHRIFTDFYHSIKWPKRKEPFIIVQDHLEKLSLTDKISAGDYFRGKATPIDSALEFRPPVNIENKRVVYLSNNYKKLLDSFIKEEFDQFPLNTNMQIPDSNLTNPSHSWKIRRQFEQYMGDFLGIAAHTDNCRGMERWFYDFFPKVEQIILNPAMNRAVIEYRFPITGGQAILEKRNNQWVILEDRVTWME